MEAVRQVTLYDPAINLRWAAVLEQMEALFAPLLPMLREFLPEADDTARKSDPKAAAGGAKVVSNSSTQSLFTFPSLPMPFP